jgi:hypothetical protein
MTHRNLPLPRRAGCGDGRGVRVAGGEEATLRPHLLQQRQRTLPLACTQDRAKPGSQHVARRTSVRPPAGGRCYSIQIVRASPGADRLAEMFYLKSQHLRRVPRTRAARAQSVVRQTHPPDRTPLSPRHTRGRPARCLRRPCPRPPARRGAARRGAERRGAARRGAARRGAAGSGQCTQ